MTGSVIARALRLGDDLLREQCETGDPVTHAAVEHAVDVLTQRIAQAAEADSLNQPLPRRRLPHLELAAHPAGASPPGHEAQVSCQALAMRLRQAGRELTALGRPGYCDQIAPAAFRLAAALDEHAIGLDRQQRTWPLEGDGRRRAWAQGRVTRLQGLLLAECRAVVAELCQ